MAKFSQDIGDVSFPYRPFSGVDVDKSKATMIKAFGAAIEGGLTAFGAHRLTGPKQPEDLGVTVQETDDQGVVRESVDADLLQKALSDKNLNFRRIAAARRQGLISATEAKTRVGMAVQRASSLLPGKADEYRKMAAAFFGDFGEGQDLLDETPREKMMSEYWKSIMLAAAKDGYKPHEVDKWMALQRQFTGLRMKEAQHSDAIRNGQAGLDTIMDHAVNSASLVIGEFAGEVNKIMVENGGIIPKPEELITRLSGMKVQVLNKLQQDMTKGRVMASDRSAALKSVQEYFQPIEEFINSGNLHEILKNRAESVKNLIQLDAANAFYFLSMLNAAGGQEAVNFGLTQLPELAKKTPDQRAIYWDLNPMHKLLYNSMNGMNDIAQARQNLISSFLPSGAGGKSWDRTMTLEAARFQATKGDTASPYNGNALSLLQQAHEEGQHETLGVYADPATKSRTTPTQQKQLMNWVQTDLSGLAEQAQKAMAQTPGSSIVFQNGRFHAVGPKRSRITSKGVGAGVQYERLGQTDRASGELIRITNRLNQAMRVMQNYADTPAYQQDEIFQGRAPAQVLRELVTGIQLIKGQIYVIEMDDGSKVEAVWTGTNLDPEHPKLKQKGDEEK